MSRQIDFTQPLSDEDRQWLLDNGRVRDVELADAMADSDDPESVLAGTGTPTGDPGTGIGTEPTAIGARQADGVPVAPSATDPNSADLGGTHSTQTPYGEPVTEPFVTVDEARAASDADPDGGDNYDDEEAWPYRDLQNEVKGRREAAGDSYDGPVLTSPREELIEWLRKDDERDDAETANSEG